jgi:putative ABC transport system permease protein
MLADLRYALRLFAKSPLFTAAVVLVLGLGIGASTTVFTLVDAYLLKPLPFPEPERVVSVWRTRRENFDQHPFSQRDFLDLKEQAASFSQLAIMGSVGFNLGGGSGAAGPEAPPEHVLGSKVSADFFPALGASAALGRAFTADEDTPGRDQVVVLSDAFFRRRFHGDPATVGRAITLDGKPYQVVGVMPESFRMATNLGSSGLAAFWVPAALTRQTAQPRGWHSWHLVGRIKPGASFATADAEVRAVAARLEQAYPDTNTNKIFYLLGLQDHLVARIKPSLTLLFFSTLLLLVIASANVALLLLARASARESEVAVRAALGASRPRLLRQLLTESVLLALLGGLAGFALALAGTGLVATGYGGSVMAAREVRPDARVLLFALALASVAGLGFGLLPAFRASKVRLYELLKEGATRATSGGAKLRLQAALLVAEVALSAVLLAGSAAVARGFYKTLNEPLGFRTDRALTFQLELPKTRYPDVASLRAFHATFVERLRALPAVSAVGTTNFLPLSGSTSNGGFEIEGKPPWPRGSEPWVMFQRADRDYFRALGTPLVLGRAFGEGDDEKGARVIIVSESFVSRYLPGENPIGKRVRWGDSDEDPWMEIVGVVGDVHYTPWETSISPASYVPFRQATEPEALNYPSFVVRTDGEPHALANAVRAAVAQIDGELPVFDVKTYEERVDSSMADRRFTLLLVSAFAGSALLLTALGLFGLVSYQTKRRSRELAIRMALGAASGDVRRLVLRDTSRLLVAGLALGLPAAFATGRLLASRLNGVPPTDPLTLAATALLLGLVALAAVLAPAQRAARTPPALVLRDE